MLLPISTIVSNKPQQVPLSKDERERIRTEIETLTIGDVTAGSLSRSRLEELARFVVQEESHLAWTMVLIGSRFWRKRVEGVPFRRRILLLPHCMRNAEQCPAKYDADGLHCVRCGCCELGGLKEEAEQLGYTVLIAEGSPVVMQLILNRSIDAVLGVGCLRSLERAFEKLQIAGIPALAVPLYRSDCKDSRTDIDWVREMIHTPFAETESVIAIENNVSPYLPLLREAAGLFDENAVLPGDIPSRSSMMFHITQQRAKDFLVSGGKFYRPFVTLATYDALTRSQESEYKKQGQHTALSSISHPSIPPYVKSAAQAVEIFHKASLIHDDIEDDDPFRYGKPTLHKQYGTAVAVNLGDYLLGLGYRNIAALRQILPNEIVAEMLVRLSEAHLRLSEGQGAELSWKEQSHKTLTPEAVLKIYVLKTAPAFEAAMCLGILSAIATGDIDWTFYQNTQEPLSRFARHLGVAFQIKNDIDDWFPDDGNKQVAGNDALKQRPTLLRALAEPHSNNGFEGKENVKVQELYELFQSTGAFDQARQLIGKTAQKARRIAEEMKPLPFQKLLLHFVETIAE